MSWIIKLTYRLGNDTQLSKGQTDLELAINRFEKDYRKFARTHQEFITINDDFHSALTAAQQETNVHRSAELFRKEILNVVSVRSQKETANKRKALSRVGQFLGKLYPMANISLCLAGAVSGVHIFISTILNSRALGLHL